MNGFWSRHFGSSSGSRGKGTRGKKKLMCRMEAKRQIVCGTRIDGKMDEKEHGTEWVC